MKLPMIMPMFIVNYGIQAICLQIRQSVKTIYKNTCERKHVLAFHSFSMCVRNQSNVCHQIELNPKGLLHE